MKSKYTKKNNRDRQASSRRVQSNDVIEDNLLERILSEEGAFEKSNDDFDIDIIGMSSDEKDGTDADIDYLDDELDDDMASRLSLYESMSDDSDDDDEIKEFVSRDVVAESRRRVNQPGRRKFEDSEKSKRSKISPDKQSKRKMKKEP